MVAWQLRGYAATGPSATKGRSSRHIRHTIRASRLAIAAVAIVDPQRSATARAQVRNGVVVAGFRLCESTARAPCIKSVRRYRSPCLLIAPRRRRPPLECSRGVRPR